MNRLFRTLGLLAVFAGFAGAETLEERVKALEEKLKLKESGDGEAPEPGSPAAMAAGKKVDAYFENGQLKLKSADGNLEARIGGRVIFHGRFFSAPDRQKSDSFSFREVKMEMYGKLWKMFTYGIEATSSGPNYFLDDAYVGFEKWSLLKIRVGQFKAPFSMDQLTSTNFIDMPERSPMDRLVPGYDLGILVFGEPIEKILNYSIMLANGTARAGTDENSDKDIFARAFFRPFATSESDIVKGLHIGINFNIGNRNLAKNTAPYTFSTPMCGTTFANLGAGAVDARFDRRRSRIGFEFAWLFGPAAIKAEWMRTTDQWNKVGADAHDEVTHITAYYITASCLLTGESKSWDRPNPNKPLFGSAGGIGQLEVVGRFSRFEFNKNIFDQGILNENTSARNTNEFSLGLNWYPNTNVRVSVAGVHEAFQGDLNTKPLVIGGTRVDAFNMLIFRIAIAF